MRMVRKACRGKLVGTTSCVTSAGGAVVEATKESSSRRSAEDLSGIAACRKENPRRSCWQQFTKELDAPAPEDGDRASTAVQVKDGSRKGGKGKYRGR